MRSRGSAFVMRGALAGLSAVVLGLGVAGPAMADFGLQPGSFNMSITNSDGSPDTQAGSHPYAVTTSFAFNATTDPKGNVMTEGSVRDVVAQLPAGLVGNPQAVARCSLASLEAEKCPTDSQVGVVDLSLAQETSVNHNMLALYNIVPRPGVAAEFAFLYLVAVGHMDAQLRSGGDYGITITSPNVGQGMDVVGVSVTFWGVPGATSHDQQRCVGLGPTAKCSVPQAYGGEVKPFLRLPTSCSGEPLKTTLEVDSWQKPGSFLTSEASLPALTGCYKLDFSPSFLARPDTSMTDSAAGLHVSLSAPQNENVDANGEADLKNAVVQLPAGVTVNPAQADGLVGCSEAQIALKDASVPTCPGESKIGSLKIETPLLPPGSLTGSVYLAQQGNLAGNGWNPFGSLMALYLVAHDPETGVVIKLPGEVKIDPITGRLTVSFLENPPMPFTSLEMDLFGGQRGALITPQACGMYSSSMQLTPWSSPEPGTTEAATLISDPYFEAALNCAPGFSPSFTAGTTASQAGGFSPFTMTFSRTDAEQRLSKVSVTMPPGLSGMIRNVTRCAEPQASLGQCGPGSLIGHATVGAGAGSPFYLTGGVYLTGPYEGAPFGLAIVVPANAGPFKLGDVITRAALAIDPHTAQVTVTSGLPQTVDTAQGASGIPTDLRVINVTVDRPEFMFNPTDCEELKASGTLTSVTGQSSAVSQRFQVANCAKLAFKPSFKVSTSAKTSRKNGASLHVVVRSGAGQANIHSVHVTLPKIMPSRLPTLQQACIDTVFNENPAKCPAGSKVGGAVAHTPVLAKPLSGPMYFVSHGGAAFPDLVAVLQGEGVTVELVGQTAIKNNVTSSTFASVPDVPITRFDMTLPQGSHSVLTTIGSPCKQKSKLTMPTTIRGQNGAVVKQTTKIAVSGCPKAKKRK